MSRIHGEYMDYSMMSSFLAHSDSVSRRFAWHRDL